MTIADISSDRRRSLSILALSAGLILLSRDQTLLTTSAFSVATPAFSHSRIGAPLTLLQSTQTDTILNSMVNGAPLSVESATYDFSGDGSVTLNYGSLVQDGILPTADPAQVEFVTPDILLQQDKQSDQDLLAAWMKAANANGNGHYPFAAMMQGSGPFIADHAGKIAVFHIPAEIVESKHCDALLQDMALCWLLDMKIVIVVAVRYANVPNQDEASSASAKRFSHECHNALKVTNPATLRLVEEEAGFLRTELERKLNRCLRAHHGLGDHNSHNKPPEGNVVSGNFYTAHRFGVVRGKDYEQTGYASEVYAKNIRQVLNKNDIVLLSTVGLSAMGELVNVNGYHLAATVAASLQASKVIYLASQGSVLRSKNSQTPIQELPISFAESICAYHQVSCSNMGFATFQSAKETLEPSAVELLLHMAWSHWSVKNGTSRAHICNPSDGSVLEELFTAKNGANTCIYHDDEISSLIAAQQHAQQDRTTPEDWDDFFASASAQGQSVA
jgi:acetylglutamate kinase